MSDRAPVPSGEVETPEAAVEAKQLRLALANLLTLIDTDPVWRASAFAKDARDALLGADWTPPLTQSDAAELAAFRVECDKVGIPHDPEGLVRHHRNSAAFVAALNTESDMREAGWTPSDGDA